MPTSRRRRTKPQTRRPPRPDSRPDRRGASDAERGELARWQPLLLATDQAESRGDAAEALRIMSTAPADRDGQVFWRPERIQRLHQLVELGAYLPRWATSRWVLAQAAQFLSPATQAGHREALTRAVERRGVPDSVRREQERRSSRALRTTVMDHDWLYRQLALYDFGGLEAFLRLGAAPDLLARADQMHEWAAAPMGGYRFVEQTSATVVWHDLSRAEDLVTDNVGSAALVLPGDHVIGRCVPITDGQMFESVPLLVPRGVAERVAVAPYDWLDAVSAHTSRHVSECSRVMTGGQRFQLLTDVHPWVQAAIARAATVLISGLGDEWPEHDDPLGSRVDLVRMAVDGSFPDEPEGVPIAPLVTAILMDPLMLAELEQRLTREELERLAAYSHQLPPPCADLCELLLAGLARAS